MAEVSISVKHLDDVTECAICRDVYTDPRSLPCIHTFCLKCIAKWFEEKLPQDSANCPLCRLEFKIPDKGLAELPKNIFIGKLLALKELASPAVAPKVCGWCKNDTRLNIESKTAKLFCVDCQEYLCENCKVPHSSLAVTRSHRTLIPGEGLNEVAECMSSKCDKHTDKDLEIHCFECKDTVCLMCFVTQHNGHKASDVKEVAGEFKLNLNKNIFNLADGLSKLDRSLVTLETRRNQIADQASEVEDEICKKVEELIKIIDRQKDKLLLEVRQLKVDKTKVVENVISEVRQNKAMIESLMKYSQELLKKGSYSDITRESRTLNNRAEEMARICDCDLTLNTSEKVICFTPAEHVTDATNFVGAVKGLLGRLRKHSESSNKQASHLGYTNEVDTETLTHSIPAGSNVWAVAALGNELFAAYEGKKYVTVYDSSTCQQTRQITMQKCDARGLATCSNNGCLYVSDFGGNKIYKVSLSTYSVSASWSTALNPAGLSVNRSYNLLVSCYNSNKIQEYSSTGSLIREISTDNKPWQAVERSDRTLSVITQGPMFGVSVISVDGTVLYSYGSTSQGSGLWQVKCLVVDKENFVLVVDHGNNRILVFNPTLSDSRILFQLLPCTMTKPFCLWLEESHGRLYVGEYNSNSSRIHVYVNVFNVGSLLNQ